MMLLSDLPALVLAGIASGSTYALLALGLVIIFRSTDTMNFAIGHIGVLALYCAAMALSYGAPLMAALVGAVILGGVLGIAAEWLVIRPVANRKNFAFVALVITIGLSFLIQAVIGAIWGHVAIQIPVLIAGTVRISGFALAWNKIMSTGLALVAMGLVALFFDRTALGISMRAAAEDHFAARVVGLNPRFVARLAWFLGCALATMAMFFLAAEQSLTASLPDSPLFRVFAGVFLGGLSSMPGAVLGGFAIGVLDNLAAAYVSPNFRDTIVFGVIFLVLFLRPAGLLGTTVRARV